MASSSFFPRSSVRLCGSTSGLRLSCCAPLQRPDARKCGSPGFHHPTYVLGLFHIPSTPLGFQLSSWQGHGCPWSHGKRSPFLRSRRWFLRVPQHPQPPRTHSHTASLVHRVTPSTPCHPCRELLGIVCCGPCLAEALGAAGTPASVPRLPSPPRASSAESRGGSAGSREVAVEVFIVLSHLRVP